MYIGLRIAAFMFGLGIAIPAVHATLQPNSYPPTGAVLSCQGRPWIDIMCYGADQTGVADSFTAINTAITDAIAAGGVPVHFPSGTFKIGSKLTLDYTSIAATGLKIISDNATLNAVSLGGTALQIQCSGGTPGSPALCNNLEIQGPLTVKGNAPNAYVVVIGTTNFADQHSGVRINHLIATNAASAIGAGGIQLNYIVGREIWISGNTLGGGTASAVALEQVQNSRISGDGTASGPTASSLMIENGVTTGNLITAFDYNSGTAISLSITSPTAKANTFLSPVFNGTTAINANQFASGNAIIGPTYNGTNKGPSSTGVNILGRGSLSKNSAPTASTLLLTGADNGTIFSPANGTGAGVPFAAVTLNFTLPIPSQVGDGWTVAFLSDNSKASVINSPGGSSILTSAGQQLSTMTVGAPNAVNYEVAVIESDGTNFRLLYATPATMEAIGAVSAHYPSTWEFPSTSGYAATQNDNGNWLDSTLTSGGLTVTLPPTTSVVSGWVIGVDADGGKPGTVITNGVSGGHIISPSGEQMTTYNIAAGAAVFQFDGANFRVSGGPPFVSGITNYVATPIYSGGSGAASFLSVLGSLGTPDNTINATAIFQKITTGFASGSLTNPAVYVSSTKTGPAGNTVGYRTTGIIAEAYDLAGGFGTFVEGGRFHGTLGPAASGGQANGIICLAQNTGATAFAFLIGCEAAVENAGFDAPVSTSFNGFHFVTDFLATIQNAGSHIADAAFMVNPFNAKAFRVGFFIPAGANEVTDSAFRSAATSVYGLDLRNAVNTYSISLPNGTPMSIIDSNGTDHNIMYMPTGGVVALIIGTGTQGFTLPAVGAPATPGAGFIDVYFDGADNLLKTKDTLGIVRLQGISLSTPPTSSTTCTPGQVVFDSTFIYTCYSTNAWHRVSNGTAW